MNLREAANTYGITIDLLIEKGYVVKLNIDYSDDSVINYWQAIKGKKIINTEDVGELLGLTIVLENEGDGVYYKNESFETQALKYAESLGYTLGRELFFKASKAGNNVCGATPFSLVSMIEIAERYGDDWRKHISSDNYDYVIEESCFEMPVQDVIYINGRGFALCGKVKEGRAYRGTQVRVLSEERETKVRNIPINGLEIFGYIPHVEKGDNIGLGFSVPGYNKDELEKLYPIQPGDKVLYANYEAV